MRIDIPVYQKIGGKLKYSDGNAVLYNQTGDITWKYDGKKHKGIAIAGACRSGTVYIAKVLGKLGYRVGHEEWGEDGSVGYHLAVIKPANCLHQVRHPLDQIASMMVQKSWGWCDQVIEVPDYELLGCMRYWLMWNALIEKFAVRQYCIEDLPDIWDEFCSWIGHERCELPDVPTDTNKTRYKKPELTWDDLFDKDEVLARQIYEKALFYGYSPLDKENCISPGQRGAAQVA